MKKRGFRATQITVEHEPEHKHRHLHHITAMIDGSALTPRQQELAKRIFQQLAEAEAKVHGIDDREGALSRSRGGRFDRRHRRLGDRLRFAGHRARGLLAGADGHGFVEIAHGRCSIPAPATGELLRGVPLAALDVEGELTTPTGAAIVAALADEFGPLPAMTVERIGYGAGQKDFPQPNIAAGAWWAKRLQRRGCAQAGRACAADRVDRRAGNKSRRRERRDDRPRGRAIVGGRGTGRVADGDPDEEGPAGRAGERAGARRPMPTDWKQFCLPKRRRSACGDRR